MGPDGHAAVLAPRRQGGRNRFQYRERRQALADTAAVGHKADMEPLDERADQLEHGVL